MKEFNPKIRELKVLAEIAHDLKEKFVLYGSVANAVLECFREGDSGTGSKKNDSADATEVSLFSLVPALADIDFLCEPHFADELRREIWERLPLSKFFHLEVRAIDGLDQHLYTKFGNVEVRGLPQIEFLPSARHPQGTQAHVILRLGTKRELLVSEPDSLPEPEVFWRGRPDGKPIASGASALLDLLFLLRKFNNKADAGQAPVIEMLSAALEKRGGREVGERISRGDGAIERVQIGMFKYLLNAASHPMGNKVLRLEDCVDKRFWQKLGKNVSGPLLNDLVGFAHMRSIPPLAGVIQPALKRGRWRRSLVRVQLPPSPSQLSEKKKRFFQALAQDYNVLKLAAETDGAHLSPVFTLTTDEPPDPDCCRYRDFSRGIAEAAWVLPKPPKTPLRQLLSIVRMPEESDPVLAHSWLVNGAISSVRLDYGFLCTMAGRRRAIKVIAIALRDQITDSQDCK